MRVLENPRLSRLALTVWVLILGLCTTARAQVSHPPAADASLFGLVHAVEVSNDGIVYVADRTYRRIQTWLVECSA